MTMTTAWCPDRRMLMRLGLLGAGALATPGAAQVVMSARGFTHGVASGEPTAASVLLWTRYVASSGEAELRVEVAEDAEFARVISGGTVVATATRDFTAKVVISALAPGRWYYYRFIAADGSTSCIGRTRTLPEGATDQFRLAVFSCSNMGFGWFNAYAHAGREADFDLSVHLGDYFYEYAAGQYPPAAVALAGRDVLPASETIHVADYRLRFASYRSDAALQRLHQIAPMIAMWDDHETANDAWSDGAQNHDPETEGDWQVRKAAALQVYREWMPVSDAPWRSYQVGDLATIALPETRVTGRMQQLDIGQLRGADNLAAALATFRDEQWAANDRTLLGAEQERWLEHLVTRSARSGTRWQVLAQQVIMGEIRQPPEVADWVPVNANDQIRQRLRASTLAAQAGLPFNLDAWDGYPAARARLLSAAQSAGANIVTLSGDSHNGWAFNLTHDGRSAGVEFAGPGVTSPGFEAYLRVPPADVAAALVRHNPQLVWADTSRRGYMHVTLSRDEARSEWRMWDSVRHADAAMSTTAQQIVRHGRNRLS